MEEIKLYVDLYKTDNGFGAWVSDNIGGSGIEVEGSTPEKAAQELSSYIEDYFCRLNENEDED